MDMPCDVDPPTTGESRSSSSDLGATLTTSSTRFISAATRRRQEASSLPDIGPRRMFTPTKAPTKSNDDSKEGSDVVLKDKRGNSLTIRCNDIHRLGYSSTAV